MPFENFDNKLREAADQHHPNYDEKAWTNMEKLLDQHLPLKNDRRRRFIFLLLLFVLVGGGAWLIFSKPWQQDSNSISVLNNADKTETKQPAGSTKDIADKTKDTNQPVENDAQKESAVKTIDQGHTATNDKTNLPVITSPQVATIKKDQKQVVPSTISSNKAPRQDRVSPAKNDRSDQVVIDVSDAGKTKKVKDQNPVTNSTVTTDKSNDNISKTKNSQTPTDPVTANNEPGDKKTADKTIEEKKDNTPKPEVNDKENIAKTKKGSNKKNSYFFFSVSAAPDISSVSIDNPGKVKLLTGAGFGYSFKNKWTIRTGFYTGRKIYSANKEQYKPDIAIPNYTYLDQINADCKVYEIPLNLSYNFSKSAKQSLFATVGLSSLIMKKEVYDYLYKYPGNPPPTYTYTKTINNENKHYFSILTLSGGYGRAINKTISVSAEPYIKLPLTGVGFGKVKLNSAGVLVSVNIAPFRH